MNTTPEKLRVAIVDANDLARTGCRVLMQCDSRFDVIASAPSVAELECELEPDLVVLDPSADGGLDARALLAASRSFPGVALFLLSDSCDGDFWVEAFRLGACGLLPKSS